MTKRTWIFCVSVALALAACSDDPKKDGTEADCEVGEVFNPVTGSCMPAMSAGNNGTPDFGNGGEDAGNGGQDTGGGSTDMGMTPDLSSSCEGNERRCNGNVVERCMNGTFEVAQTCGEGLICERGNCIPESTGCTPGMTRCVGTAQIQTCEADGETWSTSSCPEGEACAGGECSSGCAGLLTEKSNVGCEYITMRHQQLNSPATNVPHTVVVSNPGNDTVTVTVEGANGTNVGIAQQTIAPLDSAAIDFPLSPAVNTTGLSSNFYIIRSSEPVIATQFAPMNNPGAGRETSDASLLLPTNALGMEYVIVGWRALEPQGTYLDIVATQPDTTVSIESPLPLTAGAAGSVAANSSSNFTIGQNQVLHITENRSIFDSGSRDVTGVRIVANKPVAVFTGATLVNIPDTSVRTNPPAGCGATDSSCSSNDDCCSGICGRNRFQQVVCLEALAAGDHVEQQLFPVESWGTSYVATPFYNRGANDFTIYRVIASEDATSVSLSTDVGGVTSLTLNGGEMAQLYARDAFELIADKPVLVGQFMIGGSTDSSGDGDPAFLLPPAVQQFRDSYVFMTPGNYDKNYVTLIKEVGEVITLDNVAVAQSSFTAVPGSSLWEFAIIDSVAAGVHRATSAKPFGVIVHGMDNYISYAFAGGIVLPD